MVLSLDLRKPLADSAPAEFTFGARPVTVMDIVLGLDAAERDNRVKGVFVRVGGANCPSPQAEEIGTALKRFRASGKFVIAHAQGFEDARAGRLSGGRRRQSDLDAAQERRSGRRARAAARFSCAACSTRFRPNRRSPSAPNIRAPPTCIMEKGMTAPDREQLTRLMQSWYDNAVDGAAADRKLDRKALIAAFEASPQFTEEAQKGRFDRQNRL